MDCLYETAPADTSEAVIVEGIVNNFGFDPKGLERNKTAIIEMLNQLPNEFKEEGGGGWSFLNACNNAEGQQWADEHRVMEQLFTMGLGIGKVTCPLPRELWSKFPGGTPYYMIKK